MYPAQGSYFLLELGTSHVRGQGSNGRYDRESLFLYKFLVIPSVKF